MQPLTGAIDFRRLAAKSNRGLVPHVVIGHGGGKWRSMPVGLAGRHGELIRPHWLLGSLAVMAMPFNALVPGS
jgi:hypothetical protein